MLSLLPFRGTAAEPTFIDIVRASNERKTRAAKRLRYYHDQSAEETIALIRKRWSRPEDFRVFQINLVRKIINKRATTYRLAPKRIAEGWNQETLDAIYADAGTNMVLKRASRLTKLLKVSMIQVAWRDDRIALHVITPNILDVIFSDPENPVRVIVTHPGKKSHETTYSDWTAETYHRRDHRGAPLPIEGNPGNVNPYLVLPFVPAFDRHPEDEFFVPGGNDLIEAQEAINVGLANLWRSVELQAHGQAWATGVPAGDALKVGPDRAITLPENGKFGFAAPNAPIDAILSALEFVLRQTAATNDLSADVFDLESRAESGAAKMVEQIDLREARQDDIDLWRQVEDRLFEVIKVVVNTHRPGMIPEAARIRVDFAELTEAMTERERLENGQRRVDLGIASPVDLFIEANPDIGTREDALAELQRRREETATLSPGLPGPSFEETSE